jgi:hypothetical protein
MASVPTPPAPGSMTVPPTFGWQDIAVLLTLVVLVAVVAFVVLAAGRGGTPRQHDWQAWLDGRSAAPPAPDESAVPDSVAAGQAPGPTT